MQQVQQGCRILVQEKSIRLIDYITGNDDAKLIDAWKKLWHLVFKENEDAHKKIRKSFVNGGGLTLFLKCAEKFPGNTVLIGNMVGCISGVVLDSSQRPKMMTQNFAQTLVALSDTPDVTELSINAIEILCHMLNDGKSSWRKTKLSFTDMLVKTDEILHRWDIINVKITLQTDSFESIFVILASKFPQLQHYGLWNIACFTRQNDSMCINYN